MERHYIRIPGRRTHELPPLFVHPAHSTSGEEVLHRAADLVEAEEMLPAFSTDAERRKFDLALHLVEQYARFIAGWQWGDSILGWTRQCEITFEAISSLRHLLHPDVWPHASRSSFVALLAEKAVPAPVPVEKAVGWRLTFRHPPPIDCFSNQFLLLLNSTLAESAYNAWAHLNLGEHALLPPDRFHFELIPLDASV
jgi:hypothetical protein